MGKQMKYFELQRDDSDNLSEFLNEKGNRFDIKDIESDEDHDLYDELEKINENVIPLYKCIEHPKSNPNSSTYILIFEDGSIFEEEHGCFDPIRITHELRQ